jgi:23S rRNA pseudouridine1911/1915/1917 synthase
MRPRDGVWDVPAALDGRPLDGVIRNLLGVPWAEARRLIETGKVLVGGQRTTAVRRRAAAGERVEVRLRAPRPETERRRELEEELVVYVDASVVVVNKPAGVSTVPYGDEAPGEATLDALVRDALARRDRIRGRAPLGVVQRLDKGTSGLLVFARTLAAKKHLAQQLRLHTMHRRYLAIAHGVVKGGMYRSYLVEDRGDGLRGSAHEGARAGQLAVTHVEPLEVLAGGATLVSCRLETGRTHQIRIHLAEAGHPLVGEAVYIREHRGPRIEAPRVLLHAAELGFRHPADERSMRFQAPPPEDFQEALDRLRQA